MTVTLVEPDFVTGPHSRQDLADGARLCVDDHVPRRGGFRIPVRIPRPDTARRVEHHIAADQQSLPGPEGEAGRRAELDRIDRFDHAGRRDAHDSSVRGRRADLRDGEIELAGGRIPHRLFGAVGRINPMGRVEVDVRHDGESPVRLVDLDQGAERRI